MHLREMLADESDYLRLAEFFALRALRRITDYQLLFCAAARGISDKSLFGNSVLTVYRGLYARLREAFALAGVEHTALNGIERQFSRIRAEDEHRLWRDGSYSLRRAYRHLFEGMGYLAEGDSGEHEIKKSRKARGFYRGLAERLRRDIEQRAEGVPEPLRLESEHIFARILEINREVFESLCRIELAQQLEHSLCAALAVVIFELASELCKRFDRLFAQGVQPLKLRRSVFGHLTEPVGARLPFFQPARAVYLPEISVVFNIRYLVRRKRAESGFQSAQDAVGVEARVGYFQRGTNERHQRLIYNRLASVLEHGHAAFCERGQHRADIRSFVAHDNRYIAASVLAGSEHSLYMRRGIGTLAADIGRRDYRYAVARSGEYLRLGAQEVTRKRIERGIVVLVIDNNRLCARHADTVCKLNELLCSIFCMIEYIVAVPLDKIGRGQRDINIVRLGEYLAYNSELLRGEAAEGVEEHRFIFKIPAFENFVFEAGQHAAVVKPSFGDERIIDRENERNIGELAFQQPVFHVVHGGGHILRRYRALAELLVEA